MCAICKGCWCPAEDVVTRLLPSQQMPALNKAAASEGEPTAAAPADQMFSHHPALWESLASPADPSPHSQHPPVNVLPTEQHSPATSQPGAMQLLEASRSSSMHARPHAVSSTRSAVPTQSQAENSRQRQQHLPQPAAPSSASLNRSMPGAMNNILPWRRKEHYAELMSRGRNHAHGRPADQEGHCNNIGRMESVLSQTCKGNSLTTSGNRHSSGSNSSTVSSSGSASQPVLSSPTDSTHNAEDQSQPGAASTDEAAPGFWSRTAKLAHLVSFPIRMSRAYYSYVPVGRQLYLQPSGLTSTLHAAAAGTAEVPAQAQSPVAANMETKLGSSTINADGNSSSSSKQDAVVQRRKELLGRLWMHRMPTYRARIQQILYAALGQDIPEASMGWDPVIHPIPASAQTHSPVQLARRPVAPKLEVMRAETSTCALLGSNHFKEVLKVAACPLASYSLFSTFKRDFYGVDIVDSALDADQSMTAWSLHVFAVICCHHCDPRCSHMSYWSRALVPSWLQHCNSASSSLSLVESIFLVI